MKSLAFIFILSALCSAQTNPTSYGLITDTKTYISPAPALGVAGTTTTDPDFGTTVMRVTSSGSCGATAGASFTANEGPGWEKTINSNDTAVLVSGASGNWYVQPVTLNGTSMSLNGSCVTVDPPLTGTEINFSLTDPSLVFGLDGDSVHADSYNWTTATKKQLFNVSTISGFSYSGTLYLMACDTNDAWCGTSNGVQNAGTQIAFYNLKTNATEVVNIANATVQLGSASLVAMDNATSTFLAGCGVHEIIPSQDGTWWTITLDGCTYPGLPHGFDALFWQLGTNHVTYIQDINEVGGHEGMGVGPVYIASPGTPSGCLPYTELWPVMWNLKNLGGNPGNWVGVLNCSSIWPALGNHLSWLNNYNDSYANSYPILSQTYTITTNTGVPYEWELDLISLAAADANLNAGTYGKWPSSSPTVWRAAHTYNDPINSQCRISYISPNISADGQYVLFTSDWLGGTGSGSCTNSRRTDVFLVALPLLAPTVSKVFSPSSIASGGTSTMSISITNPNPVNMTGVAFTDNFTGSGMTTVNATVNANPSCGSGTATQGTSSLTLAGGTITPGATCVVSVSVTSSTVGANVNPAGSVTAANATSASWPSTMLNVLGSPTVLKSFNPSSIALGGNSTLSITTTNPSSNLVSITGLNFWDDFSDTGIYVVGDPPTISNSCGGSVSAWTFYGYLGLSDGSVAAGEPCTVSVLVGYTSTTSPYPDNVNWGGIVSSANAPGALWSDTALNVQAPMAPTVTQTFTPPSIAPGGNSILSIAITNTNPTSNEIKIMGSAFTVAFPLSSGLRMVPKTASETGCGGGAPSQTLNSLTLSAWTVGAGATCTVWVSVTSTTIGSNVSPAGLVNWTNAPPGTPPASWPSATLNVLTTLAPTVTKTFTPPSIASGKTSTLSIQITNPNSAPMTGVVFTDNFAGSGMTTVPGTANADSCGSGAAAVPGTSSLTLTGGTIAAGAICTVSVQVTSSTAGANINPPGWVNSTNAPSASWGEEMLTVVP